MSPLHAAISAAIVDAATYDCNADQVSAHVIGLVIAALKDGPQVDAAAEVLDYWAARNGAFAVSSVKAANRQCAREAWNAALDKALACT